ncbi:putative membrane protein [Arcobacter venerupis]|uniref:Membrane protein n=1 Tax=Arcobacter venerupis TaxID=1054033 RepID=A0AAE7B939_9BACT|nr:hypothetical protein [Arcobacter venerupis]QKF67381.1 putative membrane protein [Arcobacter venerupis]RWS50604.1 hypothetical protein CKA56_03470 [Arcobacter venerupis]
MTRNNLDNPIFLFIVLLIAIIINAIASIHFLLIMFAGILFTAFYRCLRKRYLYSLTFVVITFLFIEINTGLKPFTLTLLSLFIYIFILPKDENHTSYNLSSSYIYIIFFYIGLIILWSIIFGLNTHILITLAINVIIDLIFFGVFL